MDRTLNTYNVGMYATKDDKLDLTFQIIIHAKTLRSGGAKSILLGSYFNVGNYLKILNNLILPQLNANFHKHLENGMFKRLC